MKTFVIVNPASSGGATQKNWLAMSEKLRIALPAFDTAFTEHRGHATSLAKKALLSGYERIIAVGGDGTVNEVVNGFFDGHDPVSPNAHLGVIDAGTGGDFRRNIGLGGSLDEQVKAIASGRTKDLTLGYARFEDAEGKNQSRYFAVICSFGISGEINHYVNQLPLLKRYGSGAAFAIATLKCLFSYANMPVNVVLNEKDLYKGPLLVGAACNGPWTGGGMMLAPKAESFSAELDFVVAGDLNLYESLMVFPRIYNGSHIMRPKVKYEKGNKMVVKPQDGAKIIADMDGDVVGYLPLVIESRPAAIKVLAG